MGHVTLHMTDDIIEIDNLYCLLFLFLCFLFWLPFFITNWLADC